MFRAFTAKVKSVNGETCTVELEGITLTDVRLRAVVNGENSKILVTPKTDSYVLVVDLAGDLSQLAVVGYSEVEKIEVDTDKIIFNGGNNNGLVKIEELKRNLNSLKNYVEAMASAVSTAFSAVGIIIKRKFLNNSNTNFPSNRTNNKQNTICFKIIISNNIKIITKFTKIYLLDFTFFRW